MSLIDVNKTDLGGLVKYGISCVIASRNADDIISH